MEKITKINLTGKWIVLRWERKVNDNAWTMVEDLSHENFTWDFGQPTMIGRKIHGRLKRITLCEEPSVTDFTYNPDEADLHIKSLFYTPYDYIVEYHKHRFRTEQENDNELVLYDLKECRHASDIYYFRLILKKQPLSGD